MEKPLLIESALVIAADGALEKHTYINGIVQTINAVEGIFINQAGWTCFLLDYHLEE